METLEGIIFVAGCYQMSKWLVVVILDAARLWVKWRDQRNHRRSPSL